MKVDTTRVPPQPICQAAQGGGACRFAGICHETRQRIQHYSNLRGTACWAFQQLSANRGSESVAQEAKP